MIRIVLCFAFACSPAATPPPVTIATPPSPRAARPLSLSVQMMAERGTQKWSLAENGKVKSGDLVELFVTVNQPAYVYVVQFEPDGSASVLFPPRGDHLVQPGSEQKVPEGADNVFQLDTTTGRDHVYVLMSREPIGNLDAALGTQITEIREAAIAPPTLAPEPPPTPTPPAVTPPEPPPAVTPPAPKVGGRRAKRQDVFHGTLVSRGGFLARRLEPTRRPGAPIKLEVTANRVEDPLVVVEYHLEHE
jgi:hypothetical protein